MSDKATLFDTVLALFPRGAHAVALAHDPDDVLGDEAILGELAARGYRLVQEPDPVRLRLRVEALGPWTMDQPLLVITDGPPEALPYDLWSQGQRVTLALHAFFPQLSYPLLRELTPGQRARLAAAPPPASKLGPARSLGYVLRRVFEGEVEGLTRPAGLLAWLSGVHARGEALPPRMVEWLCAELGARAVYAGWPLRELLADRAAWEAFLQREWQATVAAQAGEGVQEEGVPYHLSFAKDPELRRVLPTLVQDGSLAPVAVVQPERYPAWARAGVRGEGPQEIAGHLARGLQNLAAYLASMQLMQWQQWQEVARRWAQLTLWRYGTAALPSDELQAAVTEMEEQLDGRFQGWLQRNYASLAVRRSPTPHHVYHAPYLMAQRAREAAERGGMYGPMALLALDGLSLADWLLIRTAWRARHPGWRLHEDLLLAQVPTITAISRQALVSGRPPCDFAASLTHNGREGQLWRAFWEGEGLPEEAIVLEHLDLGRGDPPAVLSSSRIRALCLVERSIDELAHGATLGASEAQRSLEVWLGSHALALEEVIDALLRGGYTIYVASDHGHVQATGMGVPAEGLTVQTGGQRARLYADRAAALRVHEQFPATEIWPRDHLLPDDLTVLLARGRGAYTTEGKVVVTHGGLTLEEVVAPLVVIEPARR